MGGILSYFFVNKGRTDDPDPITGFTSRDKYLINTTWNRVMDHSTGNGVAFFMRFFEINPKHKEAFPFRNVPTEELPANKRFHAHVTTVMYSLSSMVSSMDDPEMMTGIIKKVCQNHVNRSVDQQALIDVKQALLDIFSYMSKEELESWTKFMDYFIAEGIKTIEEHSKTS